MRITLPSWLSKRKSREGRLGIAIGPDGWGVVLTNAKGSISYCQFHSEIGNPQHFINQLVEQHDWEGMPCSIVLHPLYYQLLLAETPPVPLDEMAAAIRWRIKDLLDFPIDDATIEFFTLPEDAYRSRKAMLYAAVLRRPTLESMIAPIEASGVAVDCVEIAELALHKLSYRLPSQGGGFAVLHLLESEGFVNLIEGGNIYLSRYIEEGLSQFRGGGDKTRFSENLLLEVQRSLDFYESQFGKGTITELFYSPGIPEMMEVGGFISEYLDVKVTAFDLSDYINDAVDPLQLAHCSTALGAAIGLKREGKKASREMRLAAH